MDVLHDRLGHANVFLIKRMRQLNQISNLAIFGSSKCEIYVETRHHKKNPSNM